MKAILKKMSALILALGVILILGWPSLAHAADTGGADHFELTVVENKDSKSGAEIADLTIKNISGKTGTNVTFEADLPTIFQDKDLKKATFNVGTLKAGESKTYQVSRKTNGTVATTPLPQTENNQPTTGTTSSTTNLPKTGKGTTTLMFTLGFILLASVVLIGGRRFRRIKHLLLALLLFAGLGGAVTVKAAEGTYHHRDEVNNYALELAGTTRVFHLAGEGDFENNLIDPDDKGGESNNFTITY